MKSPIDSPLGRTITSNSFTPPQPTQDKRKMVSHLQSLLKSQIQKREQAQRHLMDYRRRSLSIEQEFSRILQKYDNHVAVVNGHGSYGQDIWNKLVDQIQRFNTDSQRMLAKRCGEIEAMMSRRVNEILDRTETQIKRNKKLSEEEYRTVKQEIKEALKLARDIEGENENLKKENRELLFKVNMLKQQKNLLIGQLNQKKLKLKQIMIELYEENQSQSQSQSSRVASPRTPSRVKKLSSTIESPIGFPKFICQPSFREKASLNEQSRRMSYSRQKDRNQMLLKTDNHIKLCYDRQRRKNAELKAVVSRLHATIKEVVSFIEGALIEKEGTPLESKAIILEKLVEKIKSMLFVPATGKQAHFFSSVQLSKLMRNEN